MALRIVTEANRCLQCKKPLCQQGCPASTPIPEIIKMFRENKIMDAGAKLFANNPLSLICSIVCDHEAQCAGHCVLGKKGSPVLFYKIEEYLSDTYLDRMKPEAVQSKKHQSCGDRCRPVGNDRRHHFSAEWLSGHSI